MTERANGWLRTIITILVPLFALAVAWGAMGQRMETVERRVEEKANAETVAAQNAELLRWMQSVDRRLARLEERE